MKSKDNYKVIGVMSGTSLDGLDVAYCQFIKKKNWKFEILSAVTLPYTTEWKNLLSSAHRLSATDLLALDSAFGRFIGESCSRFIRKEKIRTVDFIASHGHTIFHQPQRVLTFQLGDGNAIHAATGIPVIYDFRGLDVALQGQGAPLVPVGDRYLFGAYDVCLNLGGIANLSLEKNGKRIAFDICFANMGLNYLARKAGKELDRGGRMALQGVTERKFLTELTEVYQPYCKTRPALTREEFESTLQKLLDQETISLNNRMHTLCESIAEEIFRGIPRKETQQKVLVTGGGAHHPLLMRLLSEKLPNVATVVVPADRIIEFKEAMVFAFLGVLRVRGEVNVLKSVTRASRDSCSGVIVGKINADGF